MTIGIGLLCDEGIVICADTQITSTAYHKYYEEKIYWYLLENWKAAFTFAGNPHLMKSFDGKFREAMALVVPPFTAAKIQDVIETILSLMDTVESDPEGLHMMAGIVIPSSEMRLLKTDRKIVTRLEGRWGVYDYVGVGDSSVLRYLGPLLTAAGIGSIKEAMSIGVYLTQQAKRYVDGCGGDTRTIVLRQNGAIEWRSTLANEIERHLLALEESASNLVAGLFPQSVSEGDFEATLHKFCAELRDFRKFLAD